MKADDLDKYSNDNLFLKKSKENMKEKVHRHHVLVIGGAGYIGSVLTRKLLSKGYRVRVLDKLIYGNGSSISDLIEEELFSFVFGDFGENEILERALTNITDVVLLAALVGDPICKKYPELARKTNVDYPQNLIQKLNGRNISKFVFTSTCSNYGLRASDTPADEDSELNPQSLYAETKIATESYILDNIDKLDLFSHNPKIIYCIWNIE